MTPGDLSGQKAEKRSEQAQRENLLHNLRHDVWVRLGSSSVHGVGVFALRDIPEGTDPFLSAGRSSCQEGEDEAVAIPEGTLASLHPAVRSHVTSFFNKHICSLQHSHCHDLIGDLGGTEMSVYSVIADGPNKMDVSFYINHSRRSANLAPFLPAGCTWFRFKTTRMVREGEELFFDYHELGQDVSSLKD
mmetsp:Transcript_49029/g.153943  ORF Transcript_49029/g.153943 Transcript_49029/m.153943 type:complete len:190 (-) Transcript_49029:78-647(-)